VEVGYWSVWLVWVSVELTIAVYSSVAFVTATIFAYSIVKTNYPDSDSLVALNKIKKFSPYVVVNISPVVKFS